MKRSRSTADDSAIEFAKELFAPLGAIHVRKMFGGAGVYADGVIFAILVSGEIFLRVDEETEPLFRAAGSRPFTYDRDGREVAMRYWSLPEDAVDDHEAAVTWGRRALGARR